MEMSIEQKENMSMTEKSKNRLIKVFQFKSLRSKILFSFSIIIVLVLALTIENYVSVTRMNQSVEEIMETDIPLMIANERAAYSVARRSTNVRAYLMTGNENYRTLFEENVSDNNHYFSLLQENVDTEEMQQFINQHEEWTQLMLSEVFDLYANGQEDEAEENLALIAPSTTAMLDFLSEHAVESQSLIDDAGDEIVSSGHSTILVNLGLSILVIVFSLIIAFFTARSISNPIKKVMEKMTLISNGNLQSELLIVESKDETGNLAIALNTMQDRLKGIIQNISDASHLLTENSKELSESASEVMSGTDQVAMTMQELATGSETQAGSASKLAAIMDNFSKQVENTTQKGNQIKTLSDQAVDKTASGRELMDSSEKQMVKINDLVKDSVLKVNRLDTQTKEISKLVAIIQEVANQTNLLALNAAIEAARAGEDGKGFAVVAEEVRKLAEQVEESVSEITGFVETIQEESRNVSQALQEGYNEVEAGTTQIKETGNTFNQISHSLNNMAKNILTINKNLEKIEDDTNEMNTSIEEIASVTEESAAGVEQTSAATQEINSSMEEVAGDGGKVTKLVELAENMSDIVSQFTL